jgi:hypothetical protein
MRSIKDSNVKIYNCCEDSSDCYKKIPTIGENGNWFIDGDDTEISAKGKRGKTGPMGPRGKQGHTGPQGEIGPAGPQGLTGAQGYAGPTGPQGLKGDTGAKGDSGPQGIMGLQGAAGPAGPQGAQGAQGPKGDTPPLAANLQETVTGKALDATMGKRLSDSLGGLRFYEDATGKYVVGADSVPKKLGNEHDFCILYVNTMSTTSVAIPTGKADEVLKITKDANGIFSIDGTKIKTTKKCTLYVTGNLAAYSTGVYMQIFKNNTLLLSRLTSKSYRDRYMDEEIAMAAGDYIEFRAHGETAMWFHGTFTVAASLN